MLSTNNIKALKTEAKGIYFENSTTLSFVTLLFIALNIGFTILGGVYGSIILNITSEKTVSLATVTFEFIGIILSFPLLFGYIYFCSRTAHKEDARPSDVFEYYSDRKKFFCASACFLKLLRAVIFKILLPVISFVFLYSELDTFCSSGIVYLPDYLLYSIKGLFLLPFLLLFALCYYSFGNDIARVMMLNSENDDTVGIIFDKKKFFTLRLSLIPLYLVSFLTFGIMFITFTIPYTVILYSLFFRKCNSEENSITLAEFDNNTENADNAFEKTIIFNTNTDITFQDNTK